MYVYMYILILYYIILYYIILYHDLIYYVILLIVYNILNECLCQMPAANPSDTNSPSRAEVASAGIIKVAI